ncbi:hypothetical protein [Dyadobacter sp. CY312]|uniref:hypothetical protein n=1 Tax=Dyadobacter sp. CY312 TaxID=2907303 RepID=UPI001F1DFD8A|nr:hypothetical protein [Dyadobacter sp. CY312]MCE7042332.1 hypothetical protein [Dyadobacter sp. CY312]
MNKLVIILLAGFLFLGCEKKEKEIEPENINSYGLDATFDDGRTVHFSQFSPETTFEGILTVGCFFDGDQMAIGFGATNYQDPTKSNGFDAGFKVTGVTSARAYQFAKENTNAANTSTYIKRIRTGSAAAKPSPLLIYDNRANYRRFPTGEGLCSEEEQTVDFQTIDVTKYSDKDGGTIEGTFDIRVYNKPEDNCLSYQKTRITGVFKLKRANFE